MARISMVKPAAAEGQVKVLMDGISKKLGMVPNVLKTLGQSPAALGAYVGMSEALAKGTLSAQVRESVALAVAEANECDYCLAAHTSMAKMAGLSDEQIRDARRGQATERRVAGAVQFARDVVDKQGFVSDEDLAQVRSAGFSDGEILELLTIATLNIFTNYANHIADPVIDFPKAEKLAAGAV